MTPRLNPIVAAPALMQNWLNVHNSLEKSGVLEAGLMDLVKIRASQINHCANCLHMHTPEARERGEAEERIYLLDAWRESLLYSDRERAALAWTDALTQVAEAAEVPDDIHEDLDVLPERLQALITESVKLQGQVVRLDQLMDFKQPEPDDAHHPVGAQFSRLQAAFNQDGE